MKSRAAVIAIVVLIAAGVCCFPKIQSRCGSFEHSMVESGKGCLMDKPQKLERVSLPIVVPQLPQNEALTYKRPAHGLDLTSLKVFRPPVNFPLLA